MSRTLAVSHGEPDITSENRSVLFLRKTRTPDNRASAYSGQAYRQCDGKERKEIGNVTLHEDESRIRKPNRGGENFASLSRFTSSVSSRPICRSRSRPMVCTFFHAQRKLGAAISSPRRGAVEHRLGTP